MEGSSGKKLAMELYNRKSYISGMKDFLERSNQPEAINSFLSTEQANTLISYDNLQTVLSVGSGDGPIECYFMSLCNNIKSYTCIEPECTSLAICKEMFDVKYPGLNVKFIQDIFENYPMPEEPLNALLFVHSIYAFMTDLRSTLRRAVSFVKEGGKVVIIMNDGTIFTKMGSTKDWVKELVGRIGAVRDAINELNLHYEEEKINDAMVDLTNEGENYYGFLDVFTNGNVSRAEKQNIVENLKEACKPGTRKLGLENVIFVITK